MQELKSHMTLSLLNESIPNVMCQARPTSDIRHLTFEIEGLQALAKLLHPTIEEHTLSCGSLMDARRPNAVFMQRLCRPCCSLHIALLLFDLRVSASSVDTRGAVVRHPGEGQRQQQCGKQGWQVARCTHTRAAESADMRLRRARTHRIVITCLRLI